MPVLIGPGQIAVERHAGLAQLDGQRLGQPDHAVLRCDVGRVVRRRAQALGRGDVHDPPVAVALQIGEAVLDEQDVRGEVDVDGAIARRRESPSASMANGAGCTSPALFTRMSIGPSASRTSSTTRATPSRSDTSSTHPCAVPPASVISFDHGLHAVLAEVDDGHLGALIGEQVRRRAAHAAGRSGHDCDASAD